MKKLLTLTLALGCLPLVACETAEETLGLTKSVPDEFSVVKRAPLQLPPDYSLRPPRPGAARPQEQEPVKRAKEVVFGGANATQKNSGPSNPEELFLLQAGTNTADPAIRAKVDEESANVIEENKPVGEKLFDFVSGNDEPPGSIVDAQKEQERIQKNVEEGKPINEGDVPTIDE